MLAADRDAVVRETENQALFINGQLLDFLLNNLSQVQQAAVLLGGFGITMLVNLAASNRCPDIPLSPSCKPPLTKGEHPLEDLPEHFTESLGIIGFMFLLQVVIQTLLLQVMAPKLALLGPDGSFQFAVQQLREEQFKIIPSFIIGLVVIYTGAWTLTLAISTSLLLKVLCSLMFLVGAIHVFVDCLRILKLFHLKTINTTAQISEDNLHDMGNTLNLTKKKRASNEILT